MPEGAASGSETSRSQHTLPPLPGTQHPLNNKASSGSPGQTPNNRESLHARSHKSKDHLTIQCPLQIH